MLSARFRWSLCALVITFVPAHLGQARQPAAQPTPLEFYASASDEAPVRDLTAEELTLKISGRTRVIRSLQWIDVATPRKPDEKPAPALPSPFGSNVATTDGRAVILVIDDDSFRPGREAPLRDAVNLFLANLSTRDRVSLVTVPYGGLKVDFTTEHERVSNALLRIVGQAAPDQTGSDLACRTRRTLEALVGLLDSLGGGQGPTTVLFVSAALAGPRRDAAANMAPGMCELTTDHFNQVGAAAAGARAHFYVVQSEDATTRTARPVENIAGTGFLGSENPQEGLEHLAGVTGGHQLPLLSNRESNLNRVVRETTGYYVLDVRSGSERTQRQSARGRFTHVARGRGAAHPAGGADCARRGSDGAVACQPAGHAARDARLPRPPLACDWIRVGQHAGDKNIKVLAVMEALEGPVKLTAASAGLVDSNGKLIAQWTANAEELANVPVVTALIVPPGVYRLRMAATDATGRAGSADYEVEASLALAGGVNVSALVLGLSRAGGFLPRLEFRAEPVALAYLELYGEADDAKVSVDVALSLTGPALVSVPAATQATKDPKRHTATAAIPVGALTPGDYVVRATVSAGGQSARIIRTLRKAR